MKFQIFFISLSLCATSAFAASKQPVEPVSHPSWQDAASASVQILRNSLVDPDSLNIQWVSGFRWGFRKPVVGKRVFGWIACGNFNARNRMGGYVGMRGFTVVVMESGEVSIFQYGDGESSCFRGSAPVNPELISAMPEIQENQHPSMAAEISKLADLRSKGIITEAEFEAAKAKLLTR